MDISTYIFIAVFAVIFIAVVVSLVKIIRHNKTRGNGDGQEISEDPDRQTDEQVKNLSAEELYEKACGLLDEDGLASDYDRWEKLMSAAADKGYIPAVREWGVYNIGKNNALGLELIIRAADAGDDKAVQELYELYYYGSHGGVPPIEKDREKAAKFIKPYAANGSAVAQRLLGNYYYYEADDEEKALEWYLKAADGGDCEAMVEAADIYAYKDDVEAQKALLLKAAEKNYADAEIDLGIISYETDDGTFEYDKAMYWYKRAAEHGSDTACCYIGEMYLKGEGVEKDGEQAFKWFKRSYEEGSVCGTTMYAKCFMEGIGVAQDKEKGIKLYKEAAEYDSDAQYALGICYLEGNGVKKDKEKAIDYLKKAANNNIESQEAKDKLAELCASGEIDKDSL